MSFRRAGSFFQGFEPLPFPAAFHAVAHSSRHVALTARVGVVHAGIPRPWCCCRGRVVGRRCECCAVGGRVERYDAGREGRDGPVAVAGLAGTGLGRPDGRFLEPAVAEQFVGACRCGARSVAVGGGREDTVAGVLGEGRGTDRDLDDVSAARWSDDDAAVFGAGERQGRVGQVGPGRQHVGCECEGRLHDRRDADPARRCGHGPFDELGPTREGRLVDRVRSRERGGCRTGGEG
jgi:hypothetical protein